LVVIGNPENRRVKLFSAAAQGLGWPAPQVVSYEALLHNGLGALDIVAAGSVVRIESPGENAHVEGALAALGAENAPRDVPLKGPLKGPLPNRRRLLRVEHGRIHYPGLWFFGYRTLLQRIRRGLDRLPVCWLNHPADVELMFDKSACQQALHAHGLPIPRRLGTIGDYAHLRRRMAEAGLSRVFVKLAYGSSASGVVALQTGRTRVSAMTSVEVVRVGGALRLYNSLRLQRFDKERDVAELIDELCRHGAYVEAWWPKAGYREATFDLRVVVIGGRLRHVVMRTSRSPLTNLHLGNCRGDFQRWQREAPREPIERAWHTCRRVAEVFPRSLYFGIDLAFAPGYQKHAVLEVNAFGDLLPNVRHRGQDTYTAEIAAVLASDDDTQNERDRTCPT